MRLSKLKKKQKKTSSTLAKAENVGEKIPKLFEESIQKISLVGHNISVFIELSS